MTVISMKEARERFAEVIEAARRGDAVTITRRGREVATITGIKGGAKGGGLPDMTAFRESLGGSRKGRTRTIADLRRAERA